MKAQFCWPKWRIKPNGILCSSFEAIYDLQIGNTADNGILSSNSTLARFLEATRATISRPEHCRSFEV